MLKYAKTAALGALFLATSAGAALAVDAEAVSAANVRTGPGTSYAVVDQLTAGEIVEVLQCNAANTWCRIVHPGPDGWVARSLLAAPSDDTYDGPDVQFGIVIQLPGGGYITFGTPGGNNPPPPPPAQKKVCVYDFANYGGASVCVNAGMSDSNIAGPWNNRVTSLRVFGGAKIRLCQNPGYAGFCNVFSTDIPKLGIPLNNKASSYQVW
jgi:hypothetical protein